MSEQEKVLPLRHAYCRESDYSERCREKVGFVNGMGWTYCGQPESAHLSAEPRLTPEQAENARLMKTCFESLPPDEDATGPDPGYLSADGDPEGSGDPCPHGYPPNFPDCCYPADPAPTSEGDMDFAAQHFAAMQTAFIGEPTLSEPVAQGSVASTDHYEAARAIGNAWQKNPTLVPAAMLVAARDAAIRRESEDTIHSLKTRVDCEGVSSLPCKSAVGIPCRRHANIAIARSEALVQELLGALKEAREQLNHLLPPIPAAYLTTGVETGDAIRRADVAIAAAEGRSK